MSACRGLLRADLLASVILGLAFLSTLSHAADPATPSANSGIKGAQRDPGDAPPARAESNPGHRWALLVGVNDYQNMPNLRYCTDDIEALRERLISGGYQADHVFMLTDDSKATNNDAAPTHGAIYNRLTDICLNKCADVDSILVAFSGHGALDDKGQAYLMLPDSATQTLEHTALAVKEVEELLAGGKCKARQRVFIIDACHAGGDGKGTDAKATFDIGQLAEPPEGKGYIRLCSCQSGETSAEDKDLRHGVFTYFLLKALAGEADEHHDGFVTVDAARNYVRREMKRYFADKGLKYRGQSQTPLMKGDLSGDIVLASYMPHGILMASQPGLPSAAPCDLALLTAPGLDGDWWFDETPWFLPWLRGEIAGPTAQAVVAAKPVDGLPPKRSDGIYDPDVYRVASDMKKRFNSYLETASPEQQQILSRLPSLALLQGDTLREDSLLERVGELTDPNGVYLLALLQHKFGRPEAEATYQRARAEYKRQLDAQPSSAQVRGLYAMCNLDLAIWYVRMKKNSQALEACTEAGNVLRNEDVPLFHVAVACVAGDARCQNSQFSDAARDFKWASDQPQAAARLDDHHPLLAYIHDHWGWAEMDRWEVEQARTHFKRAIELEQQILNAHPEYARMALNLSHNRHGLAMAERFCGNMQLAIQHYRGVYDDLVNVVDSLPDGRPDSIHAVRMVNTKERLADVYLLQGDPQAKRLYKDALGKLKYVHVEDRDLTEARLASKLAALLRFTPTAKRPVRS